MSDFRIKLLSLTALAAAFAGVSFGQTVVCAAGAATTFGAYNPTLRIEGSTELVSDVGAAAPGCTSTAVLTGGTVSATLTLAVTSKTFASAAGNSDAYLVITDTSGAETNSSGAYYGTVSGTTITFTNVTYPTAFTFHIYNVRVNANSGSINQEVYETVQLSYPSGGTVANYPVFGGTPAVVGLVQQSLTIASFTGPTGSAIPPAPAAYLTCTGNPVSTSTSANANIVGANGFANNLSFTLTIKELASGAFKTQTEEYGSLFNVNTGFGTATSGDVINLALAGVPTVATVYVPLTIINGGTTLTLQGNIPASTPTAIANYATTFPASGGLVALTATASGTLNIPYTVTAAVPGGQLTFPVPVFVTFAKNAANVQTAITANIYYAPAGAVTSPAAVIPTFAVATTAPSNAEVINPCQTTLLFPFVTNGGTFETGMAISNTTTDNLGTAGASSATPTPGSCNIWFYGNQTSPATPVSTGTLGAFSASPAQQPYYANTLTAATGLSGFTGYAIAQCNFLDAHGFVFITDNGNTTTGYAEGYLAIVLPNNTRTAADGSDGE